MRRSRSSPPSMDVLEPSAVSRGPLPSPAFAQQRTIRVSRTDSTTAPPRQRRPDEPSERASGERQESQTTPATLVTPDEDSRSDLPIRRLDEDRTPPPARTPKTRGGPSTPRNSRPDGLCGRLQHRHALHVMRHRKHAYRKHVKGNRRSEACSTQTGHNADAHYVQSGRYVRSGDAQLSPEPRPWRIGRGFKSRQSDLARSCCLSDLEAGRRQP
jgi:hypothetical protein